MPHLVRDLRKFGGVPVKTAIAVDKAMEDAAGLVGSHEFMEETESQLSYDALCIRGAAALFSETAKLAVKTPTQTVKASDLNGAPTGTFKGYFSLRATTAKGERIILIDGMAPTLTPAKSATPAAAAAPTIDGTPKFDSGGAMVTFTWDTDPGTITYNAGDSVTVPCDHTVFNFAFAQVTATFNVV